MRLYLLAVLISLAFTIEAQENDVSMIRIKLSVRDASDNSPIGCAHIISYQTMQAFSTDSVGSFKGLFHNTDSLKIFGLGYEAVVIKVASFETLEDRMILKLARRTYMIHPVDVLAKQEIHLNLPSDIVLGKRSETPTPLRSDYYATTPNVMNAIVSPLSFISYHTSKSERRKRNARKAIVAGIEQDKISLFFNRDIIKAISGYEEGEKLNNFIVFCNVHINLSSNDNILIVGHRILGLKNKFEAQMAEAL